MKARPILFSTPMVQALLAGKKTQTRRIAKPSHSITWKAHSDKLEPDAEINGTELICPYGKPGDFLWVRETFQLDGSLDDLPPSQCQDSVIWYFEGCSAERHMSCPGKLRPSIHMPRWASRLTLEITNIRVERIQQISEKDAIAEGVNSERWYTHPTEGSTKDTGGRVARSNYKELWEAINGKESWDVNPWVWVVEFKVHECNIDNFEEASSHDYLAANE